MTTIAAKIIDHCILSITDVISIWPILTWKAKIPVPTLANLRSPESGQPRRQCDRNDLRNGVVLPQYHRSTAFLHHFTVFLSLPLEVRRQCVSWLFEGALSRFISDCERIAIIAPPTSEDQDSVQNQPRAVKVLDENNRDRRSSRKGMPWSPEEKSFLLELRREQNFLGRM